MSNQRKQTLANKAICQADLSEALNFPTVRDLVADASSLILVQLKAWPGDLLVEVLLSIGVHQQLIKVICDAATILDLTDHVAHSLPGWPGCLLGIHLQQMILQKTEQQTVKSSSAYTVHCRNRGYTMGFSSSITWQDIVKWTLQV